MKMVKIARRQCLLNELFESCFKPRHCLSLQGSRRESKLRENIDPFQGFCPPPPTNSDDLFKSIEMIQSTSLTLQEILSGTFLSFCLSFFQLDFNWFQACLTHKRITFFFELVVETPPEVLPIELILRPRDHVLVIQLPSPSLPPHASIPMVIKIEIQSNDLKLSMTVEGSEKEKQKNQSKLERILEVTRNVPVMLQVLVKEMIEDEKAKAKVKELDQHKGKKRLSCQVLVGLENGDGIEEEEETRHKRSRDM